MKLLLILFSVLGTLLTDLEQKTLQSDFTLSVSEEVNAPLHYTGTITMCGDRFRLSLFDLQAAYDGHTLYMYAAETDELTLSTPTAAELLEANPFLYAKSLADQCNATERTAEDGRTTLITLPPKDAANGITRVTLRVRTSDGLPLQIDIKEGKRLSTLRLTNPACITTPVDYTIRPEAKTFVNDLR